MMSQAYKELVLEGFIIPTTHSIKVRNINLITYQLNPDNSFLSMKSFKTFLKALTTSKDETVTGLTTWIFKDDTAITMINESQVFYIHSIMQANQLQPISEPLLHVVN